MVDDTLPSSERADLARQSVQSAEHWLRRIIHHQLLKQYGATYLSHNPDISGKYVVNVQKFGAQYDREIDTTTFDQAIDIVLHPNLFDRYFKSGLAECYPLGAAEARFFLDQLKTVRNDVSHGRGCSLRSLQKVRCYTNDLAESIQSFFRGEAMEREYNVPMIVRFVDSLGNESNLVGVSENINNRIIDWRPHGNGILRPGDTLVAEVEVDKTYVENDYEVYWQTMNFYGKPGTIATLLVGDEHVGEQLDVRFTVKTRKSWHRQHGLDDSLILIYKVLPPP